jgi:LemA protein
MSGGAGVLLLVGGGLLLVLGLAVVVMYNRFVRQVALVEQSWSGIDVELTRRHELIPNLVEAVRGYAAHERELLDVLVRAREDAAAHAGDRPAARGSYEDRVGSALGRVLARAEAYPDLRASEVFLALQDDLALTEDRIAAARRFYNGNVAALNTRVRTVPSNLVAAAFGFRERDFFELRDPAHRAAPSTGLG